MKVKEAINNIREKKLDQMKENINSALTTKAVEKLEEKKIIIAQNYFGQK
jgi:hypothetical protein